MACEGCGEARDKCRCDGPYLPEDLAFGFQFYETTTEEDGDEQ